MWFWQRLVVIHAGVAEINAGLKVVADNQKIIRSNQATMQQQLNLLKLQTDALLRHVAPKVHAELAVKHLELREEAPGDHPPA